MKFPSIQELISEAIATLKRFPLVLLAAIIFEIAFAIIIENDAEDMEFFQKLAYCASMAIPLFFAIKMIAERFKFSLSKSIIYNGIAMLLLAGLYFTINVTQFDHIIRYFVLMIGIHLLVALSAYIKIDNSSGFWQFNKVLLLRIFTAAFFSLALWIGLSLAIVGTEKLLNFDWNNDIIYLQLICYSLG
jgi:hypothetical protein